MPSRDLTELVVAARTGGPPGLYALAQKFPRARLHLPLETLDGVKNRPETALELGDRLPVHWLQLETRAWALPAFTEMALCRDCAEVMSWRTDGRGIKTLRLPGDTALEYFMALFTNPEVDRVILNPATEAELHLARTDVDAIQKKKQRVPLWYYTRNGQLKQRVTIGESSLMSTFLEKAGGALKRIADATLDDDRFATSTDPDLQEMLATAEILGSLQSGPLASFSAEVYQLLLRDPVEAMTLVVRKDANGISVEADPHPGSRLIGSIGRAAEEHLARHEGDVEAKFSVAGSSIVMSSSQTSVTTRSKKETVPPLPPVPRRQKVFDYIPLDPEGTNESDD